MKLVPHYQKKSFPISDVVPVSVPEHMLGSWPLSITSTHSTFQSPHPWRAVPSPFWSRPPSRFLSVCSAPVFLQAKPSPLDMFCLLSPLLWSLSDASDCFLSHIYNKILSFNHTMEHHVSWSQFIQSGFRTKVNLLRKNNLFIVKLSTNFYFEVLN